MRTLSLGLGLLFLFCAVAHAADSCTISGLPIQIRLSNGQVVDELRPSYLTAAAGEKIEITEIKRDVNPRRVLFIVEAAEKRLTVDEAAGSDYLISELIQKLPESTMFAAVAARGDGTIKPFQSAKGMREVLAEMSRARQKSGPTLSMAMEQAVALFGPPQAGDAIILIGEDIKQGDERAFDRALAALVKQQVRIFCFPIGMLNSGNWMLGSGRLNPYDSHPLDDVAFANHQSVPWISWETGGLSFSVMSSNAQQEFKFNDISRARIAASAETAANAIKLVFLARIQYPAKKQNQVFQIELVPELAKQLNHYTVMYPHRLPRCVPKPITSATASNTP